MTSGDLRLPRRTGAKIKYAKRRIFLSHDVPLRIKTKARVDRQIPICLPVILHICRVIRLTVILIWRERLQGFQVKSRTDFIVWIILNEIQNAGEDVSLFRICSAPVIFANVFEIGAYLQRVRLNRIGEAIAKAESVLGEDLFKHEKDCRTGIEMKG